MCVRVAITCSVSSLSKLAQFQVAGMGPYASVCSEPPDLSTEHLLHQRYQEQNRGWMRERDNFTDSGKVVSS